MRLRMGDMGKMGVRRLNRRDDVGRDWVII